MQLGRENSTAVFPTLNEDIEKLFEPVPQKKFSLASIRDPGNGDGNVGGSQIRLVEEHASGSSNLLISIE